MEAPRKMRHSFLIPNKEKNLRTYQTFLNNTDWINEHFFEMITIVATIVQMRKLCCRMRLILLRISKWVAEQRIRAWVWQVLKVPICNCSLFLAVCWPITLVNKQTERVRKMCFILTEECMREKQSSLLSYPIFHRIIIYSILSLIYLLLVLILLFSFKIFQHV